MTKPTPTQIRALAAAISALEVHGGACGHIRRDSECPYCDDARIADEAAAALAKIRA
jgi:hypothetical protein